MPYFVNIPASTDDPKDSQSQLLANFGKLNTDFNVNHLPFTSTSTPGFHTKVQFPAVIADPNLNAPRSSLYIKTGSTGNSELFYQNGNAAANVVQLTNLPVSSVGTNFSVKTPWRLRIQMGTAASSPITFSTAFSVGFTLLTALATPVDGTFVRITGVTQTQATYVAGGGGISVRYFIVGLE